MITNDTEDFPDVHQDIDMWSKSLQSNHRDIYHDWKSVVTFWKNTYDIERVWSAYYHIILDKISMIYGKNRCIAVLLNMYREGSIDQYDPENPELPEWTSEFFTDWEEWDA